MDNWFMDMQNVRKLGRWLVENEKIRLDEVLEYFEQPHKWTPEWHEMAGTIQK